MVKARRTNVLEIFGLPASRLIDDEDYAYASLAAESLAEAAMWMETLLGRIDYASAVRSAR